MFPSFRSSRTTFRTWALRAPLFLAASWLLAAMIAPEAQAQEDHVSITRSNDELASGTLALEQRLAKPREKGQIDFELLKETVLKREPPPVFPEELASLNGKKVKMLGFMVPYDRLDDMSDFMVLKSPVGCFFCNPPSPKEVVFVRQKKKGADDKPEFISDPIEIEGTLSLWKDKSDDLAHEVFLYVINEATIKPIKPEDMVKQAMSSSPAAKSAAIAEAPTAPEPKSKGSEE